MLRKITLSQAKTTHNLIKSSYRSHFVALGKRNIKMNEASLKSKLKNLSKETGKTRNELFKQLIFERFLARVSQSPIGTTSYLKVVCV